MSDEKVVLAKRWRLKAEHDWETALVMSSRDPRRSDIVCFHCQQYVEKLLKGLLALHAIEVPKTHDLGRLSQLALPMAPDLSNLLDRSDELSAHAVECRYPDLPEPDEKQMRQMIAIAERFAAVLLPRLPRPGTDHVEDIE